MTVPVAQRETARFLSAKSGAPPRETHISAVFIGDGMVWKLKKAVRMPFLDFSTPEARHRFLLRELELNKPNAPGMYHDIVPIGRRADGSLAIGEGKPVDWVLRMAPVPAADFLDRIVAEDCLTPILLDAVGDCIFDCHARLPPIFGSDSVASMRHIAEGNLVSARAVGLPEERIAAWHAMIEAEVDAVAPMLDRRAAHGCVRRCHGDMHLANLCLWNGKPIAFDALEFNEVLATVEVAYDLAFLLMDLDLHAGRAAANRVLNRYVGRGGDVGILAALRLFLSQRAFIRAHVFAAVGNPAMAEAHLSAAERYLQPVPPRIIAIGGLQGTGKTTLARALAPELGTAPGALIIRGDETRKRLFGVRPEDRLPPDAYGQAANQRTNEAVIDLVAEAAGYGHTVIADSTFLDPAMRTGLRQAASRLEVEFTGFWLEAPLHILEDRIAGRRNDASDATIDVLHQAAARQPGAGDWTWVDARADDAALRQMREALARD